MQGAGYGPNIKLEATTFINKNDEQRKYYIRGNPWRITFTNNEYKDDEDKVHRFCVLCGENRFTDDDWKLPTEKLEWRLWGRTIQICGKETCHDDLLYLFDFVPRRYLEPYKETDERLAQAREDQCFDEVKNVIQHWRFDEVYLKRDRIPQEHLALFEKLEDLPLEKRMHEIDSLRSEYLLNLMKQNIPLKNIGEVDPFLKAMGEFYKECEKVYQRFHKESLDPDEMEIEN